MAEAGYQRLDANPTIQPHLRFSVRTGATKEDLRRIPSLQLVL
jgi:hypothetical protein